MQLIQSKNESAYQDMIENHSNSKGEGLGMTFRDENK